jgi:hypothetical protein
MFLTFKLALGSEIFKIFVIDNLLTTTTYSASFNLEAQDVAWRLLTSGGQEKTRFDFGSGRPRL